MTEEKPTDQEVEKTEETSQEAKTENMIPQSRFNEINTALKETREELNKMNAAREEARKKELEKQGEYKTLLEEAEAKLKAVTEENNSLKETQEARRKTLIEQIPEDDREIYEELPLTKLEMAVKKINKNIKVNVANPGGMGGYKTMADLAQALKLNKISVEQYKKERTKFIK